ncbi:MAG TPA: TRAP transporter small permease [Candidatus Acidoferrum sp.]|nr:TRAP transporter small permease [Candidatus Acidoferrum sp.]
MGFIVTFRRWTRRLCIALATLGAVALMVMMFLITLDVIGRDVFSNAILGTFEIVEYLMIPTVFLALAYGQFEDVHINVDVAIQFMSQRKRAALNVVTLLMTLGVFLPMAWVSYLQAMKVYDQKLVSTVLLIPRWPFQVLALVGVVAYCLAIMTDLFVAIVRAGGKEIDLEEGVKEKLAAD